MKIGKFFDGQLMTESDRCRRFRWYIWQCALGVAFDAMRHCWVVTRWPVEQGKRWNRRILWWTNNRWRILIDAWKVDSQYKKKMMNLMPSCWLLIFCARCKEVIRNLLLTILRLCLLWIISFFSIKSIVVDSVLSCESHSSVQLLLTDYASAKGFCCFWPWSEFECQNFIFDCRAVIGPADPSLLVRQAWPCQFRNWLIPTGHCGHNRIRQRSRRLWTKIIINPQSNDSCFDAGCSV